MTAASRSSQGLAQAWLHRGPLAWLLLPVAWLYGLVAGLRRRLYATGALRVEHLPVPVVVVGNLVAGGAGKTPATMAIVRTLQAHGFTPGVVSRGYGRSDEMLREVLPDTPVESAGDEPLLMRLRLGVPVVVGRDRAAAAKELLGRHPEVNLIVADDGLQHLRLGRDAQVIVFDERGAGNGWLLPAGPLREPLSPRLPPRTLVLYNAAQPSSPLPGHLAVRGLAGAVDLRGWRSGDPPTMAALHALRGRPVVAAAGLAHPRKFFDMLAAAGLRIQEIPLPDHHDYAELPWPPAVPEVLVTEKDAVKLHPDKVGSTRVWVVPLDFRLDAVFEQALLALLPAPPPRTPHGQPIA